MTDSLNTHGGLTEDSLSDPVRTHDRKGREGKGRGDRKGYPSLTLVNADTREGSFVSVGHAIDAGLWDARERHDVVRSGERTPIPHHVRSAVWYRDRGQCELCGMGEPASPWELDHIIPWSAGGSDRTTNLRVLCQAHNQQRSNYRDPHERIRRPATWWCVNCYDDSEALIWQYLASGTPVCPIHHGGHRCRVTVGHTRGLELFEAFVPWHQREPMAVSDAHTVAYCAHCDAPGLTDQPL